MPEASPAVANALLERNYLITYPVEAARCLERVEPAQAAEALQALTPAEMSRIWEYLSPGFASELLLAIPEDAAIKLLREHESVRAALLLSRLADEDRARLEAKLPEAVAREFENIMHYPPNSAGQLMDTRILGFRGDSTVAEAAALLRERRRGKPVYQLRLVDDNNRLISVVDIKDLALALPDQQLRSIAHPVPAAVSPLDPREEIVDKMERHRLDEMSVIDQDGLLLGVLRHATLIDALKEDASLDIQTMVGASGEERATSTSWFAVRKRLPWLQINLLTAFLAASVVGLFEGTIAKFTALAVLLPVVAGQSGNTGAQALAVTMRGLALREIRVSQWLQVVRKEVNAGFWNGLAVALTCGIGVYFWSGQIGLVAVIASSMVIAMVLAGLAGSLVPIVLVRLGQDPAVASSIILTTVTDISGFFAFLGIATMLSAMLS